ncbi:CHAT domain-containing protein [Dictyobacter formicarum]|uniref:Clp R domain-containing protein n=1 Tax=Dictyobacter formicarum TaxID=2778368 RepID=A0ABQ3VQ45_9CHLR|nr:CHAT domain-containing protein [Dictyobacter formicarum]GHO87829.1 hypothetical protein KSZ_58350 [Dictyobacter formicarum]
MEQPALLSIIRTEANYRFRLDLPDGPVGQEYSTDLTPELRERLRRALQTINQTGQHSEVRRQSQSQKSGPTNEALLTLGRFLFDSLLPVPLQETLRRLDSALLISTNTPDIPWELLYDNSTKSKRYICQALSVGRLLLQDREHTQRGASLDRMTRTKANKRDTQGLSVLFLVNPTSERPAAEEEVASLCTSLPESVTRIILYRQQANQLEMRVRISSEAPHVLHYAGPLPVNAANNEPALALAGNSQLDKVALEQLLQGLPKHPLVFLSYHEEERTNRNVTGTQGNVLDRDEQMEQLAGSILSAGAGAVVVQRWPIPASKAREFMMLFYQDIADGVALGEAMRRARIAMAQHYSDDTSWLSFVLYGDPTQRLVVSTLSNKERQFEQHIDPFDDSQLMSPLLSSGNSPDRRFMKAVLEFALGEARRMHKDYLGTPHLFIALTKLDGGCTQDALRNLGFSPKQVRDVIRLALGSGKATSDTPILPTRRCKEILQTAESNAINAGSPSVDERAIAQAVLSEGDGVTHELLTKLGINPNQLIEMILASNAHALLELVPSATANPDRSPDEIPGAINPEVIAKGSNSALEKLGRDLTKQASNKQLPP